MQTQPLVNQDQNNQNNDTNTKKCSNNKWQCGICNKFFASKGNLTRHEKYSHLSTKAFKCKYDQCQKTFKSKYILDDHYKRKHSTKKFKCPICNFKTYANEYLKDHINGKHIKEIEHACKHKGCDFKTFWPKNLKQHKKIKVIYNIY